MLTNTVFGFDEFMTTVGNTVMVFLPSSSHQQSSQSSDIVSVSSSMSWTTTSLSDTVTSLPITSSISQVSHNNFRDVEQKLPLENMFR